MKKRNVILLGGNTKNNIEWIKKAKRELSQNYNIDEINIENELDKLIDTSKSYKDYCIISKSIGSIISLIGICEDKIQPQELIILGLPLMYIKRVEFDIKSFLNSALCKTKILIIQQESDPIGNYNEVAELLHNVNTKLVKIPGHYHIYGNIKRIKLIIEKFLVDDNE